MRNEQRSALTLVAPVGWELLDSNDNECILCSRNSVHMISAKIRLVPFSGSEEELRELFYKHIESNSTIIDCRNYSFLHKNIKWIADSYVCDNTEERFRSLYYTILDQCYLVIEMLTASNLSVLCFTNEAKRLMEAVDYSTINRTNRVKVNNSVFRLETPSAFRFSQYSTEETLLYLSENGYLLVNACREDSTLENLVKQKIEDSNDGLDVKIEIFDSEVSVNWESVSYHVIEHKCLVGTVVYFKQLVDGESIVSFLYENGSTISVDPKSLLKFEKEE